MFFIVTVHLSRGPSAGGRWCQAGCLVGLFDRLLLHLVRSVFLQQHLQNLLYKYLFDNAPPLFRFWIISLPVSIFLARPFHLRNTYIGKTGNAVDSRIPGGNPVRSFGAAAGISGNRTGGADHAGENVQYRTILVHKAFPLHVDCMFG